MTVLKEIRRNKIFAAALFAILLILTLGTCAQAAEVDANGESLWNSGVYSICDYQKVMDHEEYLAECREVYDAIPKLEFDWTTFLIPESSYEPYGFDTYLKGIYKQNNSGYGINKDGMILGVDVENEVFMIRTFGRGKEIFKGEQIRELAERIRYGYRNGSYLGLQQAYTAYVKEILKYSDVARSESETDYGTGYEMVTADLLTDTAIHQAPGGDLPDWYVQGEDLTAFKDFHNSENTPRLIDLADIFTDEEELQIEERMAQITEQSNADLIVYTDVTSHGVDNELYCNDYYAMNGYGFGDDYNGMILYVDMDPDNREMVTSTRGALREVFTQSASNRMDDVLYNYFVEQRYGDGVIAWLDRVESLMVYGTLDVPLWYKKSVTGEVSGGFSDQKLYDEIGYFAGDKGTSIMEELNDLTEKYGYDCVICLAPVAYDISGNAPDNDARVANYMDSFYEAGGYGIGDEKSGVLLGIFPGDRTGYLTNVKAYGKAAEILDQKECDRLASITLLNLSDDKYKDHIERYLYYLGPALKSGKVPHTWPVRIFWFILCMIAGSITSVVSFARANKKMKVVMESLRATAEMVEGSLKILYSRDIYLGTSTHSVYKPLPKKSSSYGGSSSSSSGSSRSSYSSHSRSSTGASFSSSRRKF